MAASGLGEVVVVGGGQALILIWSPPCVVVGSVARVPSVRCVGGTKRKLCALARTMIFVGVLALLGVALALLPLPTLRVNTHIGSGRCSGDDA